jgi:hypothetical protein
MILWPHVFGKFPVVRKFPVVKIVLNSSYKLSPISWHAYLKNSDGIPSKPELLLFTSSEITDSISHNVKGKFSDIALSSENACSLFTCDVTFTAFTSYNS